MCTTLVLHVVSLSATATLLLGKVAGVRNSFFKKLLEGLYFTLITNESFAMYPVLG